MAFTLGRKRKREPQNLVSIYISSHGSETGYKHPFTRQTKDFKYDYDPMDVCVVSIAGLANVPTEQGNIFKKKLECDSEYINQKVINALQGRITDYGALGYLIQKIYDDEINLKNRKVKIEKLLKEIICLGTLASINYAAYSEPTIVYQPHFNKKYFFGLNPYEQNRREEDEKTKKPVRSNPTRFHGSVQDNPLHPMNGLFIMDTNNHEHAYFAISKLRVDENGIASYDEIIKRNLLTKHNYLTFWRRHIDQYDFSDIPDKDVITITDVTMAVVIFKQICVEMGITNYEITHGEDIMGDHQVEVMPDETIIKGAEAEAQAAVAQTREHPLTQEIKDVLKRLAETNAIQTAKLLDEANAKVMEARAVFTRIANLGNDLEEKMNQLIENAANGKTTSREKEINDLETQLYEADEELKVKRLDLYLEKQAYADLESKINPIKSEIVTIVTRFIHSILQRIDHNEEHDTIKAIVKNIVMRNKIKNILKTGILHKKLSLRQIIMFFRSLNYDMLDIFDTSCFSIESKRDEYVATDMHVDTQEIPEDEPGLPDISASHEPLKWDHELYSLLTSPVSKSKIRSNKTRSKRRNSIGGQRKTNRYMRKNRTRRCRRRYTTQRKR